MLLAKGFKNLLLLLIKKKIVLQSSYGGEPVPLNTVFGNCPLFEVIIVPKNGKLHILFIKRK